MFNVNLDCWTVFDFCFFILYVCGGSRLLNKRFFMCRCVFGIIILKSILNLRFISRFFEWFFRSYCLFGICKDLRDIRVVVVKLEFFESGVDDLLG